MPRLHVLLAAVCFGTTGTAQALGPEAAPATVGAARIAVGAVLLVLALRIIRGGLPRLGDRWRAAVAAGGCVAVYQLSFFAAVDDTGVAVGTVVALGSAPAFAGFGALVLDRVTPTRTWMAATALATAGVLLLVLGGGGDATVSAPGVALALVAGAGYAAFTLATKRLLDDGRDTEEVMATAFGLGALLLIPVLALGDLGWVASWDGALLALWLGAIPTALAYLLFASGLRRLAAGEVATLTLAEPATATLLGALVLAERPGAAAVAGIVLILGGLAVLAIPARAPRAPVALAP